jgi:hypothetical protein
LRLWHRIAWQFGCTVEEAQARIDARAFARWQAYLSIEPCAEQRMDYLASAMGTLIGRVEATMGGRPPKLPSRLIEFDRRPEDDQEALAAWLGAVLPK